MRRIACSAALLLACVATPAVALDIGRWLPSIDLPDWPRAEAPAPSFSPDPAVPTSTGPVADAAAPGATAGGANPPEPRELDPTAAASDREARRARPRGWRGLLPGSLK